MIKKFKQYIGEYKKAAILSPLFVIIEVIFDVAIPFLMAKIIDFGINEGNMSVIYRLGIALISMTILAMICGIASGHYAAIASAGFAKNLRREMFSNVQNFSFKNIDKFSASSLVIRLTTDITNVQNSFQMIIRVAVRCPAMLLFSLIMAFNINPKLSLIFFATIPVLGVGLFVISKKVFPIFEKVYELYDKLENVVMENLHGIRVVKSFVREEHENEKFADVSNNIFKTFSTAEKILAVTSPLMQFCVYFCLIMISWFGAKMIVSSTMTTGELMSLIAYTTQILMALMMLSMVIVMITISRSSAKRIMEVLEEKTDIKNPENPVYEVANGEISFKNVGFSYKNNENKMCLSNINLKIKSGETIGIIGGTGSSKTSLIQLIPRLYDTTVGSVEVGGIDVKNYDITSLRDQVAMVLQKNELFSGTIKENLRWGNKNATDEELIYFCKLAQAHTFIQSLPNGYDTYIEQGGTNVSGGQKQRICIARALIKKPQILILDDSTSAVDTKTEALIRKAFIEEIPNTTKIIVAQRISSVIDADKIIVMDNGNINAIGTHDELLENNQIYQEVYSSQMKGGIADDAE